MIDKGLIPVVVMVGVEGCKAFPQFVPALSEVRTSGADDAELVAKLRSGELAAGAMIALISVSVAYFTGRPEPLWIGGVAFVGMFALYELALRRQVPADAA